MTKPTTPDWKLVMNTRDLVVYTSSKFGITITLTKLKGVWYVERTDENSGLMSKIGEARLKDKAIDLAKNLMTQHPTPSDDVLLRNARVEPPKKMFEISEPSPQLLRKELRHDQF